MVTKDGGDSSSTTNNYVWIEHPLDYCQPSGSAPPGSGLAQPCRTCPRGLGRCNEWTLYAYMAKNSVSVDAGLSPGDWVVAGQPIGIEGDVGFTPCEQENTQPLCGRHVHFAIWRFDEDSLLTEPSKVGNGHYEDYVKIFGRPEVVPLFCTAQGLRYPRKGDVHVAADCP